MINVSVNNTSSFNNPPSQAFRSNQIAKPQSALPKEVLDALNAIQCLSLKIEICGSWVWIFGAEGSHEATLRAANFNWSYKRGCWYYCPEDGKPRIRRQPLAMEKIRERYGSQIVCV
jgi:hypothetical protein